MTSASKKAQTKTSKGLKVVTHKQPATYGQTYNNINSKSRILVENSGAVTPSASNNEQSRVRFFLPTFSSWYMSARSTNISPNVDWTESVVNLSILNLLGFGNWIISQAILYNRYRFKKLQFRWIPQGGSQQTGRMSFGMLTDPLDILRGPITANAGNESFNAYLPGRIENGSGLAESAIEALSRGGSYSLNTPWTFDLLKGEQPWQRMDQRLLAGTTAVAIAASTDRGHIMPVQPDSGMVRADCPLGALAFCTTVENWTNLDKIGHWVVSYQVEFDQPATSHLQYSITQVGTRSDGNGTREWKADLLFDPTNFDGSALLGSQGSRLFNRRNQSISLVSGFKRVDSDFIRINLDVARVEDRNVEITLDFPDDLSVVIPQTHDCSLFAPQVFGSIFRSTLIPLGHDTYLDFKIPEDRDFSVRLSWRLLD